ncbi:MAG TPA: ThuA domain-containing protein [Tepidisphaeraceae bacterium]|nr:ThuA domain-containing protein [Tepidisphaeraceae bacterium]
MSHKALIVCGGWEGHQPEAVADLFKELLEREGFEVDLSNSLDSFKDERNLRTLSLLVPNWTMGKITPEQLKSVLAAVEEGLGVAGCHGGMCDAFRDTPEWQFMTGGQWVAHPGNDRVKYTVHITDAAHPITSGIGDFEITSEQYYMHVDPGVRVLATTQFPTAPGPHVPNGTVQMPVVWTKMYGTGRVFYCSLGHTPQVLAAEPVATMVRRGFAWAARA